MSHYELRDAGGKSVARTRTRAAAHRASRRAKHIGASVNRAYGDRTFGELNIGEVFWFTAKRTTVRGATYKWNRGPYVKVSDRRYRALSDVAGKFLYETNRNAGATRTPPDANRAGEHAIHYSDGSKVVDPVVQIWEDNSTERRGTWYRAYWASSPEVTIVSPVFGYASGQGGPHKTVRATIEEVRRYHPPAVFYRAATGRRIK